MANTGLRLKMVSFVLEPSLLAELDAEARRQERSRSWMLRSLIRAGLNQPSGPSELVREPFEESA